MKITGFEIISVTKNVPFYEIGTGSFFIVNNPEEKDIKIYVKLGNYFVKYRDSAIRVKNPSVNQLSNTQVNTLELFSQELKLLPESLICDVIHGRLKCCNTKYDPVLNGEAHYEFDRSFAEVADSNILRINLQLNNVILKNNITKRDYPRIIIRLGTNLYTNPHNYFWDNMIMCDFGEKAKEDWYYVKNNCEKIAYDFNLGSRVSLYDKDDYTVAGPCDLIDFCYYGRCKDGVIKSFCF